MAVDMKVVDFIRRGNVHTLEHTVHCWYMSFLDSLSRNVLWRNSDI